MNFKLLHATKEEKIVIENLLQLYVYDFSEYMGFDVNSTGLFAPYPHLEEYWEENSDKFPYVIKLEDTYVGFVLVKFVTSKERSYFSIAEFFILKKYRRRGAGKAMAVQVFNMHRGQWEVTQRVSNTPAQIFWNTVIGEYTNGQFEECFKDGKRIQNFQN